MGTYTEGEENWAYQWLGMLDPGNSYRKYDYWFKKMSYMRINSIRLGYTFPERLLGHIGFSLHASALKPVILLCSVVAIKVISIRKPMGIFIPSRWRRPFLVESI